MKSLVLFIIVVCSAAGQLEEKYSWREIEFSWPSEEKKQEAIRSGRYIAENNFPVGLEIWRDKVFVTIPRYRRGVASTLNYFKKTNEKSPLLHPYPSWTANEVAADSISPGENNSSMINVYRIRADECNRLWVVDIGIEDRLETFKQLAPSSIFIYDLITDKLIRRFIIPETQRGDPRRTYLANIVVDTQSNDCGNAFAYIADIREYALIVYDFKRNKSHKVQYVNYFHFDPHQGFFNIKEEDISFQWDVGVFGLALGKPENEQGDRTVYFHPMCSKEEYSMPSAALKNETFATSFDAYTAVTLLGQRGPKSQSTAEYYDDKTGVIFYTQISRDAVGCWNTEKPYTPENQGTVDQSHERLFYPNDLKVDRDGILYVLSDRMPLYVYKTLRKEVNFRILTGRTSEIIAGTPCEKSSPHAQRTVIKPFQSFYPRHTHQTTRFPYQNQFYTQYGNTESKNLFGYEVTEVHYK